MSKKKWGPLGGDIRGMLAHYLEKNRNGEEAEFAAFLALCIHKYDREGGDFVLPEFLRKKRTPQKQTIDFSCKT